MRTASAIATALIATFAFVSCKKDEPKEEPQKAAPQEPVEPTLQVASGDEDVPGPVPPDTDMVFYVVEGALLPLACFDKAKGALKGGKECLNVVKEGDEVRVAAVGSSFNKKITGPAEPQCTAGEGKKTALGAEGITEDANFKYAAWPPSTLKVVKPVDPATLRPDKIQLSDDEKQKLAAATKKGTADELKVHQVAEVHVDANGQADKLYSVYIPHPTQSEIFTYSGMFLARDGNLDELTLVERGKGRELIKVRGTVDLNGDGTSELWIALMFGDSEGGGDRVVQLDGKKVKALAPWTCGV